MQKMLLTLDSVSLNVQIILLYLEWLDLYFLLMG